MRKTVINKRFKNCVGIYGFPGAKEFISRFVVYKIDLESPDNYFIEIDFVFALNHIMIEALMIQQLVRWIISHTMY